MKALMLLSMLTALAACAANDPPINPAADRWGRVRFLLGSWEGQVSGESGKGTVRRTYELTANGQTILEQSTTRYAAQGPGDKREVRRHAGSIFYDKDLKTFMLIHVPADLGNDEGHVGNIFALNTDKSMAEYLIFDRAVSENYGMARTNFDVISPAEFVEIFEVAGPGMDLVERERIHFRRRK